VAGHCSKRTNLIFSSAKADTYLAYSFSTGCYPRDKTEDALAENRSSGVTPVDVAQTKIEQSECSYRFCTPMCNDGRDGLNGLTIVTKPSPHESSPDLRMRSVSLRSLRRGFSDTRTTVLVCVISRTCLEHHKLLLHSRHMSFQEALLHQLPVRLDAAIPTAECHTGLNLRHQSSHPVVGPVVPCTRLGLYGHLA